MESRFFSARSCCPSAFLNSLIPSMVGTALRLSWADCRRYRITREYFGGITVGLLFLLPLFFRKQLRASQKTIRTAASAMLILMMIVAVYVHLQPAVPAAVLPLKIKPPFIPGFVMVLAATNLFMLTKEK